MTRILLVAFGLVVLTGFIQHRASAAIESQDITATLSMRSEGAVDAMTGGSFSLLAWIRPRELPIGKHANILHIGNGFSLRLTSDGGILTRLMRDGDPGELVVTADAAITPGAWAFVGVSFDAANGTLSLWTHAQGSSPAADDATLAGFSPGPFEDTLYLGAVGTNEAMRGMYGMMVARDHAITERDVNDLWNAKLHHGPFSLDNMAVGGSLNGEDGVVWMINHAMTTRPLNAGAGGQPTDRAAIVNGPVSLYNMHVYLSFGSALHSLRAVRKVWVTNGFVHRSPYDTPVALASTGSPEPFFVRQLPPVGGDFPDEPHYVPHVSPKAQLLTTEPVGLLRIIASANSRGIMADDGSLTGTGNFVHGFAWNNHANTAGVINRPARRDAGPWFGFDCAIHEPFYTDGVQSIRPMDFSRFWTGSHQTSATGPGQGVYLAPEASYAIRCKPVGLIQADRPLLVQAHVLKFPGASDVHWTANKHTRQGEAGTKVGTLHTMSLDTQTFSHTFDTAAGDAMLSDTRIAINGDHADALNIGDACYVGDGSLSVISDITVVDGMTQVDVEHPFSSQPVNGSLLRFGPWAFASITHHWPGLDDGDPAQWRGVHFTAGDGEGVVLFSFDAWRTGVDGYIFGAAGWGGNGYQRQIQRSFSDAIARWVQRLGPDVWMQMPAQQNTTPDWMEDYTAQIRAGKADTEILWLGDIFHPSQWATPDWHAWILDNAAANDVVGMTLLVHPHLGGQLDLYGAGLRSDELHLTQHGNQQLAELWTQMLSDAALPGDVPLRVGDVDANGVVNVSDLLALLGMWGACDIVNDCPGDLTGDGVVSVSDMLMLLSEWG